MMLRISLAAVALGILMFAAQLSHGWARYYSPKQGFAVFYPPDFYLLDPELLGMEAVNVPRSKLVSGGPLIPEDGAELAVGPAGEPGQTIRDIVIASQKSADGAPIIDQTLLTGFTGPDKCHSMRQVEVYENYGGPKIPVLQHITSYYCEAHGRNFAVTMYYWEGNKEAPMLEGMARTVAKTLTVYK